MTTRYLQDEVLLPHHAGPAEVRKKLVQRRAEQFELLAQCEITAIMRTTPSPEVVKRRRVVLEDKIRAEHQTTQ
ncbi:hypothetical protein WJX75_003539 [Coccomyxa subellipsoidea]|uniref:DUF465 domain-containing protein n=1 Tax=Coccomyxa subellipsoidea TaxID=248742 RepID=A0ABR2YCA4_9CHLO